jgi:EAL domain-containing protein (putative c-di-GMP-specific phosphodiesterase class I)
MNDVILHALSDPHANALPRRRLHSTPGSARRFGAGRQSLIAIDDDPSILDVIGATARECGYDVLLMSDASELISTLAYFPASVIISDLLMPNVDGVTLLRQLAQAGCKARVIITSAVDSKTVDAAVRVGRNYGLEMGAPIAKPLQAEMLEASLSNASTDISLADLRTALAAGQLEVRYQPKVSLRSDEGSWVAGAEALVRWNHPQRGLLAAGSFVEIAEKDGLIEALSAWVLAQVVNDLGRWGALPDAFAIAVNLPPRCFTDIDFPDHVADILKESRVPPGRLVFEVTEREAILDQRTAIDVMTRLRLQGVGLSMDDFGYGHSSLAELYRMPFSEVKIDQSFVRDLEGFPDARKIIRSIIELAGELGLDCCAEGIETLAQASELRELGCSKGQGYLFGGAFSASHFRGLLNARNLPEPNISRP